MGWNSGGSFLTIPIKGAACYTTSSGEVTEWPIVTVSKTVVPAMVPRVQIPPSPLAQFDLVATNESQERFEIRLNKYSSQYDATLLHRRAPRD